MDQKRPSVVPCLRYKDAKSAISWLCDTFGLIENLVVAGEAGDIHHCQLIMPEGGMIMLGSARNDNAYNKAMSLPSELGGRSTASIYVIVNDVEAHYKKTQAAGVRMLEPLTAKEYGGSGYGCFDLEDNIWNFGDYDPYADISEGD